jgi:hypothetical protein
VIAPDRRSVEVSGQRPLGNVADAPDFITAEFFERFGKAERDHAEEARLDENKAQFGLEDTRGICQRCL